MKTKCTEVYNFLMFSQSTRKQMRKENKKRKNTKGNFFWMKMWKFQTKSPKYRKKNGILLSTNYYYYASYLTECFGFVDEFHLK